MSLSILGIGLVSAIGSNLNDIRLVLEGSREPITKEIKVKTSEGEISGTFMSADTSGLEKYIQKSSLRRTDSFTKMALLSSYLSLEDAQIHFEDKTKVGIVFGSGYGPFQTTFGFLDSVIDFGDKCASPTLFASSVHNYLASQVSIQMKIEGACFTITNFEKTTLNVFQTAQNLLDSGFLDYVLVGIGDEYCPVWGYYNLKNKSEENKNNSDKTKRKFGEGFITFLLSKSSIKNYKYCKIDSINFGEYLSNINPPILEKCDDILLHSSKRIPPEILNSSKASIVSYANLYGSVPFGNAFDIGIAALSMYDKKNYVNNFVEIFKESAENNAWTDNKIFGCLQYDNNKNFSLITLSK